MILLLHNSVNQDQTQAIFQPPRFTITIPSPSPSPIHFCQHLLTPAQARINFQHAAISDEYIGQAQHQSEAEFNAPITNMSGKAPIVPWTEPHISRLCQLVMEKLDASWDTIATELANDYPPRTAVECQEQWNSVWTAKEDNLMIRWKTEGASWAYIVGRMVIISKKSQNEMEARWKRDLQEEFSIPWTQEEDLTILRMRKDGCEIFEIRCHMLNRAYRDIEDRAHELEKKDWEGEASNAPLSH